jgi:hypothetical protein
MRTWSPLCILPNARIKHPFETEYLAIVPLEDDRCSEINSRHPTFLPFLESFTDPFRRRAIPSILIIRDDTPAWIKSWEAIAGFRDILSISTVVLRRLRTYDEAAARADRALKALRVGKIELYWCTNPVHNSGLKTRAMI